MEAKPKTLCGLKTPNPYIKFIRFYFQKPDSVYKPKNKAVKNRKIAYKKE